MFGKQFPVDRFYFVCLCWGLTSQSTIFQSCRDGAIASWVINQYFRGVKCLAQGHNTAAVGFEPPTSRCGVRHSTTEPPRSPTAGFRQGRSGYSKHTECFYPKVQSEEPDQTVWLLMSFVGFILLRVIVWPLPFQTKDNPRKRKSVHHMFICDFFYYYIFFQYTKYSYIHIEINYYLHIYEDWS